MIEEKLIQLINLPDTFIGEPPLSKDTCQWIISGSGRSDLHFNKTTFDKPTYSIYIRGLNSQESLQRAKQIFHILRNYTEYNCAIITTRLPRYVGKDDNERSVYTFQIEYQLGGY